MKKLLKTILVLFIFTVPVLVFAQPENEQNKIYKAEVIEILKQELTEFPDGSISEQQDLRLLGLEGEIKDVEIEFHGIGGYDVVSKNIYKVGDRVLVLKSLDFLGGSEYYITDYVRSKGLWWLVIIFLLSLFIVGGWKGIRSVVALSFTFLIIIKYIIPKILNGEDPILITIMGSFFILLLIIYITEGIRTRSHIAVISILISLVITIFLSWLFVGITRLTGLAGEEMSHLIEIGGQAINFKGLLLAGIIIGVLGVLDDVVISQVATVEQINDIDKNISRKKLFNQAYNVGVSHISSMANTLFLAYAGVSMPLLILFLSGQSAFSEWSQIINNEAIATEIVRTLAGSVGLIFSVPISTLIAVWWVKARNMKHRT